jgi:hypothetical protein
MIVVRLIGRLGNQLFQYAFALAEQKRLRTYVVIDDRHTENIAVKYFDIRTVFQNSYLNRVIYKFFKFRDVTQLGNEEPGEFISAETGNYKSYFAYFQSERYFLNIKESIKDRFKVKKKYQEEFHSKYGHVFKNSRILAIHYRFGDYLQYGDADLGGSNVSLPEQYYLNALAEIPDLESYFVILVTDDIEICNQKTGYLKNKLAVSDSEIIDFQILLNADTLIIANSTFSWWAAYLNKKKPLVFAPEYWLGFKVKSEFPMGIIPDKYIKVKF